MGRSSSVTGLPHPRSDLERFLTALRRAAPIVRRPDLDLGPSQDLLSLGGGILRVSNGLLSAIGSSTSTSPAFLDVAQTWTAAQTFNALTTFAEEADFNKIALFRPPAGSYVRFQPAATVAYFELLDAANLVTVYLKGTFTTGYDLSLPNSSANGYLALLAGSGLPAAGALPYGAGSTTPLASLAIGAAGTLLRSTGSAPSWASIADGLTTLGIRDTSAAFDVVVGATSSVALTAARALTLDLVNAPRTLKFGGNLTLAADFVTAGANSLTLTTTGATNVTLPLTGTLATLAGSETFSGKLINTPAAAALFQDATTITKQLAINLSGMTASRLHVLAFPSAGAVTYTFPGQTPASQTIATLQKTQTFTAGQTFSGGFTSEAGGTITGELSLADAVSGLGPILRATPSATTGAYCSFPDIATDHTVAAKTGTDVNVLSSPAASIGTTNISAAPTAGFYEIQFYLECTTAGTAGTVSATFAWTDDIGATSRVSGTLSLSVTGRLGFTDILTLPIYVASGAVSYATTVVGALGSPAYRLRARLVAL